MVELFEILHLKELQPTKAPFPMWVTESGMIKFTKELQPTKAPFPMWVTEFGMVKFTKEFPMWVTESAMVTLANCVHCSKALAEI